jgi:hypothetical protein
MIEPNFVAIGKIPGESIFVHKDDVLQKPDILITFGRSYYS